MAVAAAACGAVSGTAAAEPPAAAWRLVWADEFDISGPPDPEKWGYERGFVRNRELQWYQPENARCEDGCLVIEGRRERKRVTVRRRGKQQPAVAEYTSASVTTRGKFTWLYGRLEVRAKIVARDGLWPAIWTLGERGPWPGKGEVDVMEFYDGKILANAAWRGPERRVQWDAVKTPITELGDAWDNDFHTWRMDWDRD
ncbi:MAG: glycoside hydrolase family 16 protein, partial [Planctomycetota bacterium]